MDPTPGIGHLEKAVVTFDSAEVLEYDSAWVAPPSTALLLNWPENTAEEQIVIGAGSLGSNAVWAPWPEPIFKRFGQLSMAVPTTSSQLFLTLTPGTQFIDDFNPPKWPYAGKGGWVPYFYNTADSTRFEVTNVDNALRIHTLMPAVDGRVVILPPGPDVVVGDFYASVDIIDWPVQGLGFGIGARVWRDPDNPFPGNSIGYIGSVMGTPRELGIFPVDHPPPPAFTYDPTADYRLVFSAVGSDLSLRLVNLATGETVQMTPRDTQFQNGFVCFWMNAGPGGTCDITLDNFFVTGTKP